MRSLRVGSTCAIALLGACAAGPRPLPDGLARFADACRFLPAGFDSLALSVDELVALRGDAPGIALHARAGSDFRAPKGPGYGAFRGVDVHDFGAEGVERLAPITEAPVERIAGSPVWHFAESEPARYCAEAWIARVEDRFLVVASERALLVQALARSGSLAELLRPFPAALGVAADAEALVCTLPRPDDRTYWGRPVPADTVVAWIRPAPWRIELHHREPLPAEYLAWTEHHPEPELTVTHDGTNRITCFRLPEDAMLREMLVDLLFGLAIFI
jgi:hypothetical protein